MNMCVLTTTTAAVEISGTQYSFLDHKTDRLGISLNIMSRITRGISLEEWEEKTKLSDKGKQSVQDLQDACAELPLPANWVSYHSTCDHQLLTCKQVFGRQIIRFTIFRHLAWNT